MRMSGNHTINDKSDYDDWQHQQRERNTDDAEQFPGREVARMKYQCDSVAVHVKRKPRTAELTRRRDFIQPSPDQS